jgi:hypothetical protein
MADSERRYHSLIWREFGIAARQLDRPLYGEDSIRGEPPDGYYDGAANLDLATTASDLPEDKNMTRPYLERILEILEEKHVTVIRA